MKLIGLLKILTIFLFYLGFAWFLPWWAPALLTSALPLLRLASPFRNDDISIAVLGSSALAVLIVLVERNNLAEGAPKRAFARLFNLDRIGVSLDSFAASAITMGVTVAIFTLLNVMILIGINNLLASTSRD